MTPMLTCCDCGGPLRPSVNDISIVTQTGTGLFEHETGYYHCPNKDKKVRVPITVLELVEELD